MNLVSKTAAANIILALLSLVVVFHLLVVIGVVPYSIVWGGRLTSHEEMLRMETVSILVNLAMIGLVCVYVGYLRIRIPAVVLKFLLWLMVLLFAFNTVGNLMSTSRLEQILFTPITLLLSLLFAQLALDKSS